MQLFDEGRPLEDLGIGGEHAHAEGVCPAGDLGADTAQGDDQQRLARQLVEDDAGPARLPFLFRLRPDEVGQAAGEGEQVADGLVGDLGAIGALHVGQDDVAFDELGHLHQVLHAGAWLLDPAQRLAGADDGL